MSAERDEAIELANLRLESIRRLESAVHKLQSERDDAISLLREAVETGDWFDEKFQIEMNAHWLDRAKEECKMTYQGETHVQILERENSELQAELESVKKLLREFMAVYRFYAMTPSTNLMKRAKEVFGER
jgi:hypothetical protein